MGSSFAQGHCGCLGTERWGQRRQGKDREPEEQRGPQAAQTSLAFQPEIADVPGTQHAHLLLAQGVSLNLRFRAGDFQSLKWSPRSHRHSAFGAEGQARLWVEP